MISYSLFSILSSLCRDFGIRVNEGKSKVLTNGLGKLKFFISIHCFLFPLVRLMKGWSTQGFTLRRIVIVTRIRIGLCPNAEEE